jgi:hypothetical protein
MKGMKKRLEEVERALKRAACSEENQVPAKQSKLGPPTLREQICMHPHLINNAYFHNWRGKHSTSRRNHSLIAEHRRPGHVTEVSRKTKGASSYLKSREFSPERPDHKKHDQHHHRDRGSQHHQHH